MSEDVVMENKQLKAREKMELTLKNNWPALAVIGFGVFLLMSNVFAFHVIDVLWPGFIIAPGLLLLMPAYQSTPHQQSRAAFLAVPGAILSTVGLLLFAMNMVDHFEAWAYSWTLVVASVFAALMYIRRFDHNHPIHEKGYKLIRIFFSLFMGLAVFFEIVVFENFTPLLPMAMIGFGIYLLMKQRREALS